MNYYQHHIGDFMRDTAHLSPVEECFYRRALDWYYVNEKPLPLDLDQVNRYLRAKTKTDRTAIGIVLSDFFKKTASGFVHSRCEIELEKFRCKKDASRENGKLGGRPKKNNDLQNLGVSDGLELGLNLKTQNNLNQEPITNNQITPSNEGVARTLQGEACMAMKSVGMAGVNPSHPKLTALLEAGITVPELVAAAADAVAKGKPFAYALASAEGRRRDAATAPLPNVQPDAPVETYAQRAARQRMEEVAPMAARKAPGAVFDAAQRFMHGGDVVDVTPTQKQLQGA